MRICRGNALVMAFVYVCCYNLLLPQERHPEMLLSLLHAASHSKLLFLLPSI